MSQSDEALYDAYRDRKDEGALRALVERHWPSVFRLAHAIVRDAPSAEDVAQEALVRVVQAARASKRLDPFAGWLRSVTVNEARMSLRSKRRRELREEAAANQARPAPSPLDPAAPVREYVESLDERLRLPLVLHYGLGLTHAEVGEAIGCPAGTASSRIREGLEEVRSGLGRKGTTVELAAIGTALAALGGSSVPPVPSIESLVAKAVAAQAVGVAAGAGKKLGVAVVAFVLCAGGMGALVAKNMADEGEPTPRRVDLVPPKLAVHDEPAKHPTETAAPATASVATAADPKPVAIPFDGPAPGELGPGPKKVVFGGPAPEGARIEGAAGAPVRTTARGRVVDPQGRGVPGARVAVAGTGPRGGDMSIRLARRGKAVRFGGPGGPRAGGPMGPGGGPVKMPDFKQLDEEMQRAMTASLALRGMAELAATISAADGTFELSYDRAPGSKVVVTATVDRDGETLGAEKPLAGEDAGDIAVARLAALIVTVTSGGAPLQGAQVEFVDSGGDKASATTDAKGEARRATRAPRVLATVTKPGYATARADAVLAAGGAVDARLQVALVPEATILGTIRGPDNQPLAGVPVVVEDPESPDLMGNAPSFAKAVTDEAGRFTIGGLAPGREYELEATPADAGILKGRLTVAAPATAADFALGRAGSVVAEVKISGGKDDKRFQDWPGVEIQLQHGADWGPAWAERSVEGSKITFSRLAPGTYRVFAHPMMFPRAESEPVTIPPDGGRFATTITLDTGRTLTGRVVGPDGQPMKRARIVRAEGGMMVAMIVNSDTGKFELPGVTQERFVFTVSATGFEDQLVTADPGRSDLGDVMLVPAKEPAKDDKPPQDKAPDDR